MTVLTEEEKQLIIDLENGLLKRHLSSDKWTKIHWCNYCHNEWKWTEPIIHKDDCPVTLMSKLRNHFDIPAPMIRILNRKD